MDGSARSRRSRAELVRLAYSLTFWRHVTTRISTTSRRLMSMDASGFHRLDFDLLDFRHEARPPTRLPSASDKASTIASTRGACSGSCRSSRLNSSLD